MIKAKWTIPLIDQDDSVPEGIDIHQKFPGEDDKIWCERCKMTHRRGAPWNIELARSVSKMSKSIVEEIDREIVKELTAGSHGIRE